MRRIAVWALLPALVVTLASCGHRYAPTVAVASISTSDHHRSSYSSRRISVANVPTSAGPFEVQVNGQILAIMPPKDHFSAGSRSLIQHAGQNLPDDQLSQHVNVTRSDSPAGSYYCNTPTYPPCGQNDLNYHGSGVQEYPKIYIDFWGWSSDPNQAAPYLENYVGAIGGSSWLNTLTQYSSSTQGYVTNWGNEFGGYWYDNSTTPPNDVNQQQTANEALNAVSHFGYSANAIYVVAMPSGHDDSLFPTNDSNTSTQACGWHSNTSSSYGSVIYVSLSYQTDSSSCTGSYNNGLGGFSIVGGHEVAESITDPVPYNSWADEDSYGNFEVGDKCAWYNIQSVSFSNGTYAVQPLWSNANASSGTSVSGCVFSYSANAPAMSCTPDSYGCCLQQISSSSTSGRCIDSGSLQKYYYTKTTTVDDLYHQGTFDGQYTNSQYSYVGYPDNPDPADCPSDTWNPADPYQATLDPNLP